MRFAEEPPPTSLLWRLMARLYVRFRYEEAATALAPASDMAELTVAAASNGENA